MAQNNGEGAPVVGLNFVGKFLGWEFGKPSEDGRAPLGTVKIEAFRYDGEPFWFKAWFQPNDEMARQVQAVKPGDLVSCGVNAKAKGNYVSYRAEWIRVVTAAASVAA